MFDSRGTTIISGAESNGEAGFAMNNPVVYVSTTAVIRSELITHSHFESRLTGSGPLRIVALWFFSVVIV